MFNFKVVLIPCLFLISFSSCHTINTLKGNKNGVKYESVEINSYSEISTEDQFISGSVYGGGFVNNILPSFQLSYDVGGAFTYENLTYGAVFFSYGQPVKIQEMKLTSVFESTRALKKHEFCLGYSYPFFSTEIIKEKYPIFGSARTGGNYTILSDTKFLRTFNARLSLEKSYRRSYSRAYSNLLNDTYDNISFDPSVSSVHSAEFNQSLNILRAGVSMKKFLNTNLSVTNKEGKIIDASTSEISSFYIDLLIYAGSNSDVIDYQYTVNQSSPAVSVDFQENIDLDNFIQRKPLGIAIGFRSMGKSGLSLLQSGYYFEAGIQPGHFETLSQAFYFSVGISYGIGKWK